jgi:hypothetical protein
MSRSRWIVLVWLLAVMAAASPAPSQVNPSGYVQAPGWLALGPFRSPFACGNDTQLLTNHIPPAAISCLYPRPGDILADYDPARTSAEGIEYIGPKQDGNPVWRNVDDGPTIDDDIDLLADARRTLETSGEVNSVVTFLVTYVRYSGSTHVAAEVCGNSDDGIQLWWDDELVINNNACRGRNNPPAGQCADLVPINVRPGTHRVLLGIWQRDGGFGGSFGLRVNGVLVTDSASDWAFLGRDRGDAPAPACVPPATRLASTPGDPSSCPQPGGGPISVSIRRPMEDGAAGEMDVVERVRGQCVQGDVTATAGGSVVDYVPTGLTPEGFVNAWLLLGPFSQPAGGNPDVQVMRLDYLTDGEDIHEIDVMPKAGDQVATDFQVSAASTSLAYSSSDTNPGGIPTWKGLIDSDDTINFSTYYGGNTENVVMYCRGLLDSGR